MARSGISIKAGEGGSLYRQIVDQISERISSGVYPAGFRLPTTRSLAKELSVHRNTVVRAFEELASRGLVYTVVGSGTYVAESAESAPADIENAPEGTRTRITLKIKNENEFVEIFELAFPGQELTEFLRNHWKRKM